MYDPDGRINNLADEVDKQAPLSRLTLFSPCKVCFFSILMLCLCLTFMIIGFVLFS